MIDAIKNIFSFLLDNWLVLFIILTIIATIMFIRLMKAVLDEIRRSTKIPEARAMAEYDYEKEKFESLEDDQTKRGIGSRKINRKDVKTDERSEEAVDLSMFE